MRHLVALVRFYSPSARGRVTSKVVGNTAIACVIVTAAFGVKGPAWSIGAGVVSLALIGLACWLFERDLRRR